MNDKIEFQEVTVKVPKKITHYIENVLGQTVKAFLEYSVVDSIRADLESRTGKTLAEVMELQDVFMVVLGEKIQ